MADLQAALSEAVKLNRSISQFLKFSTYTDYDDLSGLDIDFTDGEQLLLWEELRRITDKLADVEEYMDAPETAHIDQPAAVSLTGTDLDVTWEVTSEDGAVVENALTNSGGEIAFPSAGSYTVTASVTDDLGRTFTASAAISVWDTVGLSFKLPEFAHPDETVKVKMTSENVGDSKIAWSLTVDGQTVSLPVGINGTLDNAGGNVKFLQTGTNILTASVTDSLGRAFTYEQTIEVYPVLSLGLTADAATHTDEQISVTLEKDTALPVTWSVTPSNDPSTAATYSGELSDNGGTIQITIGNRGPRCSIRRE